MSQGKGTCLKWVQKQENQRCLEQGGGKAAWGMDGERLGAPVLHTALEALLRNPFQRLLGVEGLKVEECHDRFMNKRTFLAHCPEDTRGELVYPAPAEVDRTSDTSKWRWYRWGLVRT